MSVLVLQSSWWGRKSWLLCLICLPGVSWWLSSPSSRCHRVVCGLWLWYFLIILTYVFFSENAHKSWTIYYNFANLYILTLSRHWYAKQWRGLPSISRAGHGQLVKMLTTLEPHSIFWSNFAYLYILTLSGHLYAMGMKLCLKVHPAAPPPPQLPIVSLWWNIAIIRKPPCELNTVCVLTTTESRAKILYQLSAFKAPSGLCCCPF